MSRSGRFRAAFISAKRSRFRALEIAGGSVLFLVLAYLGSEGKSHARREADLEVILFLRDELQEALDAERAASGPVSGRFTTGDAPPSQPSSRAVQEGIAKLQPRLASFRSTYERRSDSEDLSLRSSEALLAIAQGRYTDALRAIESRPDGRGSAEPGRTDGRDRDAEILRVRADVSYDTRDWPVALATYRQILARVPEDLDVHERVAECLYAEKEFDEAYGAYAAVAEYLQDRGTRLLAQADHHGAARSLSRAVKIRLWLVEEGRRGLAADLAQSFSSCGRAYSELRSPDRAKVCFSYAINLQTQLIKTENRRDLAAELSQNHAEYADALAESGDLNSAVEHLDLAIGILRSLIESGDLELTTRLGETLAQRGLVREARADVDAALNDFEEAAAAFARAGAVGEAIDWQTRALSLARGDPKTEARARLDRYRADREKTDRREGKP